MTVMKFKDKAEFVAHLKAKMHKVYQQINDKAEVIGNKAYGLAVRGACKGEAGCFYAFENGWVVGTPLGLSVVLPDVAAAMVTFGVEHVCIFGNEKETT